MFTNDNENVLTVVHNKSDRVIQVHLTQLSGSYNSYLNDGNYGDLKQNYRFEWTLNNAEPYFLCIKDCEVLYGFIVYGRGTYFYSERGSLSAENNSEFYNLRDKNVTLKKAYESVALHAGFDDADLNWALMNRRTNINKECYVIENLLENEITLISLNSSNNNDNRLFPVFCGKNYYIIKNDIIIDGETNIVIKPLPEEVKPIFLSRR